MVTPNELSPLLLEQIRSSITQRTGLSPQDWVLEARVGERMRATGIASAEIYSQALAGRGELTALIELLRVGETRFYRHESHMRALTELVLPTMRDGHGPAKVWSAGCATGEEPYTLAMLLSRGLEGHRNLDILASDISPASLQKAKDAIYREAAIGTLPAAYRGGLDRTANGHFKVADRFRSMITFEERNLATGGYPRGFDLIFCRNVLIYFEEHAKEAVLRRLVQALKPEAFLFLGYSESLRDVAGLEVVSSGECTVYRKKPSASAQPPYVTPAPVPRSAAGRPKKPTPYQVALRGQYSDGSRLTEELSRALRQPANQVMVDLDGADFLGQETADVLRQMRVKAQGQGIVLRWQATREGHLRFLRRHDLHISEEEP